MRHQDIIRQINEKQLHPVYFLHGLESYYIDVLTKYFEDNILEEGQKAFNQLVIYGKDATAKAVIDTACRYPMMAPYQLVIIKEAQDFSDLAGLAAYLKKPVTTTILVICFKHKKFDKRTSIAKLMAKQAMMFESTPVYDSKMPAWISDYLKKKKLKPGEGVTQLLAEYLGNNLSKVANELNKLAIVLPKSAALDISMVQKHIGVSKDYNVFELQKAIGFKDFEKAQRIVNYFISNPKKNPLVVTIGSLSTYFTKVYKGHFLSKLGDRELAAKIGVGSPYFVPEYRTAMRNYPLGSIPLVFSTLKEFDLKSKGMGAQNADHGELLKELVWKLMHPAATLV